MIDLALVSPKPKQVVDVLVFMFDGCVDEVRALSHSKAEQAVQEWTKKQGYVSYEQFIHVRQKETLEQELDWYTEITVEAD